MSNYEKAYNSRNVTPEARATHRHRQRRDEQIDSTNNNLSGQSQHPIEILPMKVGGSAYSIHEGQVFRGYIHGLHDSFVPHHSELEGEKAAIANAMCPIMNTNSPGEAAPVGSNGSFLLGETHASKASVEGGVATRGITRHIRGGAASHPGMPSSGVGGGVFSIASLDFGNARPTASRPKQGKNYLSQGELTSDTQIPGAGMPANTRVTSPFGYRIHPIKKTRKLHKGIDYAGGKRSAARSAGVSAKMIATKPEHIEPCMSPFDGKVTSVKITVPSTSGYGGLIKITHVVKDKGGNERTIETRYGHVEYTDLKVGDEVKKGQVVGHIGSQGGSTGPHLHFEVREKGKAYDPVEMFGWAFGPPAPPAPQGEEEDDFPQEELGDEGVA